MRLPGVTYRLLSNTCVTNGTLRHAIAHQVLPNQPLPREAEDFPRGGKYFNHVTLFIPFRKLAKKTKKQIFDSFKQTFLVV